MGGDYAKACYCLLIFVMVGLVLVMSLCDGDDVMGNDTANVKVDDYDDDDDGDDAAIERYDNGMVW